MDPNILKRQVGREDARPLIMGWRTHESNLQRHCIGLVDHMVRWGSPHSPNLWEKKNVVMICPDLKNQNREETATTTRRGPHERTLLALLKATCPRGHVVYAFGNIQDHVTKECKPLTAM